MRFEKKKGKGRQRKEKWMEDGIWYSRMEEVEGRKKEARDELIRRD